MISQQCCKQSEYCSDTIDITAGTGKIKRIEVSTGRIQTIGGKSSAFPRGGSWNAAGQILYVPDSNSGVHLVESAGGTGRLYWIRYTAKDCFGDSEVGDIDILVPSNQGESTEP